MTRIKLANSLKGSSRVSKFNELMSGQSAGESSPTNWTKVAIVVGLLVLAVVLVIGGSLLGDSDDGFTPTAAERAMDQHNDQASREQDVCFEQADRIADQQGAEAGSAKLDDCVEQYANDLQAIP